MQARYGCAYLYVATAGSIGNVDQPRTPAFASNIRSLEIVSGGFFGPTMMRLKAPVRPSVGNFSSTKGVMPYVPERNLHLGIVS